TERGGTARAEPEVDVSGAVRRDGRVDEDGRVEARLGSLIVRQAEEGELAAGGGPAGVHVVSEVDGAPGAGEVESIVRSQRGRVTRHPAVRWKDVIGGLRPDQRAVLA